MDDSRFCVELIEDALLLLSEDVQTALCPQPKEEQIIEKILPLLSFQYPNEADTVLPSKITVTELKRRTQSMDEGGVYLFPPERVLHTPSGRLTGAQIGTAYHTVMQHIVLSEEMKSPEHVKRQIQHLAQNGYLTEEEACAVSAEDIATLFASETGKIMLESQKTMREVMFGIHRPANTLVPDFESEKDIMLQGIIDCVAETEDGLYIIDYKTDHVEQAEILAEKYSVQLECYRMAAEQIFGKKVIGKLLYSFALGQTIEL